MSDQKEVEAIRRRLDLILAHLSGDSISKIARDQGTSRPTVAKWIERYEEEGIGGLLSRTSPGRPPEIHPRVREELVRLPLESRPPPDLGDQWTVKALGEAFGISKSYVSRIWQEAGINPPQHLQQVERSPDRSVPLRVDLRVPAWVALHLELLCRERDKSLADHILEALAGPDGIREAREDVLGSLRARWTEQNERFPRIDPRKWTYRAALTRSSHAD
jgi:transposase